MYNFCKLYQVITNTVPRSFNYMPNIKSARFKLFSIYFCAEMFSVRGNFLPEKEKTLLYRKNCHKLKCSWKYNKSVKCFILFPPHFSTV